MKKKIFYPVKLIPVVLFVKLILLPVFIRLGKKKSQNNRTRSETSKSSFTYVRKNDRKKKLDKKTKTRIQDADNTLR